MSASVVLIVLALLGCFGARAEAAALPVEPPKLTIHEEACPDAPDVFGCAYTDAASTTPGRMIGDVYVLPEADEFTLAHEIGHQVDAQLLTDRLRRWFARALDIALPWRRGTGITGGRSPSERFADAFAACALGLRPDRGKWITGYGYDPTLKQHRRICSTIAELGS